jgi:hypothetical protein
LGFLQAQSLIVRDTLYGMLKFRLQGLDEVEEKNNFARAMFILKGVAITRIQ